MFSLSDWTLWEIEYEREGGSVDRPVTDELLARGSSTENYQCGRARSCEVRLNE